MLRDNVLRHFNAIMWALVGVVSLIDIGVGVALPSLHLTTVARAVELGSAFFVASGTLLAMICVLVFIKSRERS